MESNRFFFVARLSRWFEKFSWQQCTLCDSQCRNAEGFSRDFMQIDVAHMLHVSRQFIATSAKVTPKVV